VVTETVDLWLHGSLHFVGDVHALVCMHVYMCVCVCVTTE